MRIARWWRRRLPATRYLLVFAAANMLLLNITLALATGTPPRRIAAAHTLRLLRFLHRIDEDSWGPMRAAANYLRADPDGALYQTVFFAGHIKFQYPPTALLAIYPVLQDGLSRRLAQLGWDQVQALNLVSWTLFLATAGLTAVLLRRGVLAAAAARGEVPPRWEPPLLAAAGAAFALTYYPVARAYTLGQIQAWINALVAALVLFWVAGYRTTGGALVGVVCLIKPQYAILLLWGAARRQWRFTLAAAATGVAGLVVSVHLFGLGNHRDYLGVLSFIARHGEGFYANQSVNGLLNRLLFNGPNLDWDGESFAPYHPAVYAGTAFSSLLLIGLALLWPVRRTARGSALDLGVALVTCTLASPVAWEHHYGVLVGVYAVLFAALYQARASAGAWCALAVSYALTSNFLSGINRVADGPWNFLQSYVLAGGLLVLALLYHWRSRIGPVPGEAMPPAADLPHGGP
jgi:hypothetical protein